MKWFERGVAVLILLIIFIPVFQGWKRGRVEAAKAEHVGHEELHAELDRHLNLATNPGSFITCGGELAWVVLAKVYRVDKGVLAVRRVDALNTRELETRDLAAYHCEPVLYGSSSYKELLEAEVLKIR